MNENNFDSSLLMLSVNKRKALRQKLLAVASVFVALAVAFLLSLPAITSEYNYICGLDEHQHNGSCYVQASSQYSCGLDESEDHAHGEECVLVEGEVTLVCGLEAHAHSDECLVSDPQASADEPQIIKSITRDSSTPENLVTYLKGCGGTFEIVITDADNNALPEDENENPIVEPGQTYYLNIRVTSPNGILPGLYQYQLPSGLAILGGQGDFIVDEENIGTWSVSDSGLVSFSFNDLANDRTDVNITAEMGATFSYSGNPIVFDGSITVVVTPPSSQDESTKLEKWGGLGNADSSQDPNRIYWQIRIEGHGDSQIPGSTLTDALVGGNHSYADVDMSNGIRINATYGGPGNPVQVSWTVHEGDQGLNWTSTGWSYVMPSTVNVGGETVILGSDNWTYWIEYTSTPVIEDTAAMQSFQNKVSIDGKNANGTALVKPSGSVAGIVKEGSYQGDSNGGTFHWEVSVAIPGKNPGKKADYRWCISDGMHVAQLEDWVYRTIAYVENDIDDATVKVTFEGGTAGVEVPNIVQATSEDEFSWYCWWSGEDDGVEHTRQILLACRCTCDATNCQVWGSGGCEGRIQYQDVSGQYHQSDHCLCWNVEGGTVFTFTYNTPGSDVVGQYGGSGNNLRNFAELFYMEMGKNGSLEQSYVDGDDAVVRIPGVFKKELTSEYNGSVANYTITVNEAKLDLVTDDSTLTIRDEMTTTLAYVGGSLVIETEDREGRTRTLEQGVDYTVSYDGSGEQKDSDNNTVHLLLIELLDPQPVKYTLNYDAVLVIPPGTTGGVKYSNSASIKLFGKDATVDSDEKIHANINISAKSYKVKVVKTDAATSSKLPGATFGLFNEAGSLITSGTTDAEGNLTFQTNVALGIVLMDHELYYIQELEAPEGYSLDDTRHWFVFCEEDGTCTYESDIEGLKRIPGDDIGVFNVVNHEGYELPETGGVGTAVYAFAGTALTGVAIFGIWQTRRRKEHQRTFS